MRYTVWHFGSLWNGPDRFHVIWNILTTISQYSLYKASVSTNIFWFVNCLYRCWESQNPKLHWSAASVLGTFCCVYCQWWVEERGCELMAKTAEIVKSLLCIEISGIKSNLVFVCFFSKTLELHSILPDSRYHFRIQKAIFSVSLHCLNTITLKSGFVRVETGNSVVCCW